MDKQHEKLHKITKLKEMMNVSLQKILRLLQLSVNKDTTSPKHGLIVVSKETNYQN